MAEFHINMVKQKVGKNGVMDRQNFWKLKCVLAPESLEIPHAIDGAHGNLTTDPVNMNDEYRNEIQLRLRKREICDHLSWYNHFKITFACCGFMHLKQKSVLTSLWIG